MKDKLIPFTISTIGEVLIYLKGMKLRFQDEKKGGSYFDAVILQYKINVVDEVIKFIIDHTDLGPIKTED